MGKNVFIVEDNTKYRRLLHEILTDQGFHVIGEAANGLHALTTLKAMDEFPDVILMDLNMPLLGGLETSRAIFNSWPKTKIIVVSSDIPPEEILKIYGLKHSISKHLRTEDFLKALTDMINTI